MCDCCRNHAKHQCQFVIFLFVAATMWRGGHEGDGYSHGTEKEVDGVPEKSETKYGKNSILNNVNIQSVY